MIPFARIGAPCDLRLINLRTQHSTTGDNDVDYKIVGLSPEPFLALYGLSDDALMARNAKRYRVDARPGYPDRVEIRDVDLGDSVILVNHAHQAGDTPYHASHAVFVREGAETAATFVNEVPEALKARPLSGRAFDAWHWMVDADLCSGLDLSPVLRRFLASPEVEYLQVHFAKRGCYAARVERV
jgi:hypothetical protein